MSRVSLLLLLVAFCGAFFVVANASESAHPDSFVVHEWGTYTSLQGSNGVSHVGSGKGGCPPECPPGRDENLPNFVAARGSGFAQGRKQLDFDPRSKAELGITQQLETPVIYFYSPNELDVQVDVSFPNGIITEVYPRMSAFTPELNQVTSVHNGTGRWNVLVNRPNAQLAVPQVASNNIWAPSRRVSANMVTNKATKENEHHIFYRGVGQWQSEISVTSTLNTITVTNPQRENVAAAFVMVSNGKTGSIKPLGSINAGHSITFPIISPELPMDLYLIRAQVLLEKALLEAGLYALEARAMVETWTYSYFTLPGIRVLYVVPREWTEAILPLNVKPTPKEMTRVLIGRIEIMLQSEEQQIVATLKAVVQKGITLQSLTQAMDNIHLKALGRFAEAKLRRAVDLLGGLKNPTVLRIVEDYIAAQLIFI